MLNVIEYGKDEYDFPALLVLGCFDAIHIGHRDLIKKAKLQAKINGLDLGVMLFRDGKGEKTVYSFEERLAILEEFSVKFVLVIDFTEEFKNTSPEDFLHMVEESVNVKAYMSGKDFRFGAKAKGKSSTLKNYAEDEENGVWYMPVKDVMAGSEKVSTTLIKSYLEKGDIASANGLLGSEFCVSGEVIKGAGRGESQLGYPTVNIAYPEKKFPVKQGVYKVKSYIGDTLYYGIANYGTCPTFGDERVALEVHFDGFSGDLYGETLTIIFLDYIRDIMTFASAEELMAQLDADKLALAELVRAESEAQAEAEKELAVAEEAPKIEDEVVVADEEPLIEEEAVAVEEEPQTDEVAVAEEEPEPEEEIAGQAESASEEQPEVTFDDYQEMDSGFGDLVEAPLEDIAQAEQAHPEAIGEDAEYVVPEQTVDEVVEYAEAVEEGATEPVEEATETADGAQEEEAEEITEETAEPSDGDSEDDGNDEPFDESAIRG